MIPIDVITIKLIAGLIGLLIVTRLLGKKEMSQITPFDFAYSLILGEIIGQTIYDGEVSWIAVVYAMGLWGLIIYVIEVAALKVDWLRKPLKGEPSILIYQGKIHLKALKENNLEMEQLLQMLRKNGIFSIREVNYFVFENDGSVSFLRNAEYEKQMLPELPYIIINEGKIRKKTLGILGWDQEWVLEQLSKRGVEKIEDVLYADWIKDEGLFIAKNEEIEVPDLLP